MKASLFATLAAMLISTNANAFINQITKLNSDANRQLSFCGRTYSLVGVNSCSSQPVAGVLAQIRNDYMALGIQYNAQTGQYSANTGNGYDPNFCDCPAPYILTPNTLNVACTNHVTGSINGQPNITGVMIKIEGMCSQRPTTTTTTNCQPATWRHSGITVTNLISPTIQGTILVTGGTQTTHANQFADCNAARPFTDAWITQNYNQIVQLVTPAAFAANGCPAGTTVQVADKNTILNQCIPQSGSNPTGPIQWRTWNYPIPVQCCR